jgi:hypothetical protein
MHKEDGAGKRKPAKRQKEKEKSGRGQKHGKKNGVLAGGLCFFLPCYQAPGATTWEALGSARGLDPPPLAAEMKPWGVRTPPLAPGLCSNAPPPLGAKGGCPRASIEPSREGAGADPIWRAAPAAGIGCGGWAGAEDRRGVDWVLLSKYKLGPACRRAFQRTVDGPRGVAGGGGGGGGEKCV